MRVAGIDGCKGGWVAVSVEFGAFSRACGHEHESLETLLSGLDADMAIVDIPIGLSSGPAGRTVEKAMRALLKGKASSVFNTPCRQALEANSYEEASRRNADVLGIKLSRQTYGIMPKIVEADQAVRGLGQNRIKEGHPEVSFCVADEGPIRANKSIAKGMLWRAGVLQRLGFDLASLARSLPDDAKAKPDDVIDAAILCWSAQRAALGTSQTIPPDPDKDEMGLMMSITA
ncbi:MAG: DUF429 domain-containing protein [Alphaproteobacteria bacterium]|jgi:predicted RNase H-like nuclease|nr:DUF429 domain-containing protein [Alphaproteobacteria bacterium]